MMAGENGKTDMRKDAEVLAIPSTHILLLGHDASKSLLKLWEDQYSNKVRPTKNICGYISGLQ